MLTYRTSFRKKARTNLSLLVLLITACFAACGDKEREQQLESREQAIIKREMQFAAKAAEYQSLLRLRDSLMSKKSDTVFVQQWPESISGNWNGKTVCRESNCSDYVVGDQRSDIWEFASDSTHIFTNIINKGKFLRVYSAQLDSTEIRMYYQSDSAATRKVEINVVLIPSGKDLIKGTQTISVNNNCTARFSVELVRSANL
ncbi:hypothetical protein [Arcticibacter sp.]|jgi:hypothetical protein|uniref:hypothetical protein n=1 Tax=Arcticibacter sp. TaxID=1872630 RepID=UPI00388D5BDF